MDTCDYYDGDKPLRDTDLLNRLNEQDDDLDRLRAELKASQDLVAQSEEVVEIVVAAVRLFNQAAHISLQRATQAEQRERVATEAHRELETLYQASQERALRAEAEAAVLHQAWATMPMGGLSYVAREGLHYRSEWLLKVHPGAALLAELAAARQVVEAARGIVKVAKYVYTPPGEGTQAVSDAEIAFDRALAAYDKAKEGTE
jgi:hypothetical protein